jgi:hypothetical protein
LRTHQIVLLSIRLLLCDDFERVEQFDDDNFQLEQCQFLSNAHPRPLAKTEIFVRIPILQIQPSVGEENKIKIT